MTSGLVGLWSFNGDDMSGTTAYDRSGSGNNGTLTNGPVVAEGKVGQTLSFDGINDYVTVTSSSSLNPTTAITISVWVKRVGTGTRQFIVSKGTASTASNTQYWLEFTAGNVLVFQLASGSTEHKLTTNATITDTGSWHHIVGTYDGTTQKAYVDGAQDLVTLTWSGSINTTGDELALGNRSSWHDIDYNGLLDETRIYNRALSATEVQSLYAQGGGTKVNTSISQAQGTGRLDSGLAGYWSMDEGTGTSITNSATIGGSTSLTGTPAWVTGQIGSALDFDGTDDTANVTYDTAFTSSNALTYSFWAKPDLNEGIGILGALNGENGSAYNYVSIDNDGAQVGTPLLRFTRNIGGTTDRSVQFTYPVSTWFHYVYTYDGASERVYINGSKSGEWAQTGSFASNTEFGLVLGRQYSTAVNYYNGALDEVRMYNRALSADEISQLYRLTSPTGVDTSLKGYWSFNGKDMSGTTAYDRSGVGTAGTLTNGPAITEGRLGQGLSFDGTNDYITFGNHTTEQTVYSTTFLVYQSGSASGQVLFRGTSGACFYNPSIGISSTTITVAESGCSNTGLIGTVSLSVIGWHHIGVTRNGSSVKVYVDGALVSTAGTPGTKLGTTGSKFIIGASYDGSSPGGYLNTRVDEVRVYNRELSATEIAALYNSSR